MNQMPIVIPCTPDETSSISIVIAILFIVLVFLSVPFLLHFMDWWMEYTGKILYWLHRKRGKNG